MAVASVGGYEEWPEGRQNSLDLIGVQNWYLGEGNGNPLPYSCLGNPMDRGAWLATSCGVARVRHNWAAEYEYNG